MMPGTYGNYNLYLAGSSAFISYAGASEVVTLPVGAVAVTLAATTKCWIHISQPGQSATAVAPSGEKVWISRIFALNANERIDVAVPSSTDDKLVQVAVIQDASAGVLDIISRRE